MAFIFYDAETTGVDTAFDQILQFAAIKTDDDLNELDRLDIRCRPLDSVFCFSLCNSLEIIGQFRMPSWWRKRSERKWK